MSSFSLSGGVEVLGFISPSDTADQYAVIDPLYGIDGFRNVDTLTDLNNIPNLRRRAGMVVGVSGGTTYYKLNSSPWNGTLSDWSIFNSGGSSGGTISGDYLPLSGGTVTGATQFDSGLSANTISASTYLNLPLDVYVTGGTYSSGTISFTNNSGGTFNVSGLISADTYVTGLTFNVSNYDLTIIRNDGVSFTDSLSILASDLTVTGGTYNSNTGVATFTNNTGGTFNVSGFITGLTDTIVTGGTYSNGTATFTNSTGGTFNVSGFYTGETSYVNSLNVGVGLSGDSATGNVTLINTSPDQIVTISGGTGILTGGTYPNFTVVNSSPDQTVVLSNGSNISVTGTYPTFTISATGLTDNNRFVTAYTYNNNTFTISDNSGSTYTATINSVTGLTVNGNLTVTGTTSSNIISATTYNNLPIEIQVAVSDETTPITTGTTKVTFRSPCAFTLTTVRASLTTAQTSGSLVTTDINLAGTTILSTKLTIDNNQKTSVTATTPPVISTSSIPDDGEITVDIDVVGNGTATGLKILMKGYRNS